MKKQLLILSFAFASFIARAQTISLQLFAQGITSPTELVNAGDSRMFAVEQAGNIRIINADGTINTTPFLSLAGQLSSGGERGLLGLAFHPQYATNGYFYVNYTNPSGNTVIARFTRSNSNPDLADATSKMELITIAQPFSNHNGGCLRFGPDGYLYVAMGDGGSFGDPNNNAQNLNSLLGKLLRLDVDGALPYSSPATNPFVGANGADEIWAYGLRNPWKFSFHRTTGELWIADVGQDAREEINKILPTAAGANYGWRCYEGSVVYNGSGCGAASNYVMPFAEYTHSATSGCSITGGYVYTGNLYPNLQGKYLFADYCNNKIGILDASGSITFTPAFSGNSFTAFGEDINGELYIVGKSSGKIFKITDTSLSLAENNTARYRVYPNPARNEITIQPIDNINVSTVSVYDLQGKIVASHTTASTGAQTVPLHNLVTGMYLLKITDAAGNVSHQRLAVQY